jgi:2-amino-4-hydroxy-6-hydroxymethyldihydropteridine diphosphokinase
MSASAYIGFGSNLGDRKAKFHEALRALEDLPGTDVKARSRLYETDPVGLSDHGPKFLNAVILVETDLSPWELIGSMRSIELALGKSVCHRSDKSRVIDLDLLLYGDAHFQEDGLEIPHPRMNDRAFVLAPLAELAPNIFIPALGRTVEDLFRLLPERELAGVRPLELEIE